MQDWLNIEFYDFYLLHILYEKTNLWKITVICNDITGERGQKMFLLAQQMNIELYIILKMTQSQRNANTLRDTQNEQANP